MRAHEFINEDLDEGLRDKITAAGLSTALAFGGYGLYKNLQDTPPAKPPTVSGKVDHADAKLVQASPEEILKSTAMKAGIKGAELAQLMAQAAHETLNFTRLVERGSKKYFRKYDPKHNPRLAKILGNTEAGDGEKFKGRGFLQITGRYNYWRAGKALGYNFVETPELLEDAHIAAKAAVWYWQHRVQPKVADFTDVKQATKPINAGLKGLADRKEKFKQYHAAHKGEAHEQK